KGRLVEDEVRARDVRPHGLAVADVELDEPRAPGRERAGEVLGNAAHERIERDDFFGAGRDRPVDDARSHRARAAGHDNARAVERAQVFFSTRFTFIVRCANPRSCAPRGAATFANRSCCLAPWTPAWAVSSNTTSQPGARGTSRIFLVCLLPPKRLTAGEPAGKRIPQSSPREYRSASSTSAALLGRRTESRCRS